LLKKISPQHNKPTNPNNEVPPQDAQLQGVVSMAFNTNTTTNPNSEVASTRCATSRG
jgi:hypothetical protein